MVHAHSLGEIIEATQHHYDPHTFDPNLVSALDKLAEQYGPLGVALAAATRSEPESVSHGLAEMFQHQRELWEWLMCDRYQAQRIGDEDALDWIVIDTEPGGGRIPQSVAQIYAGPSGIDQEDTAHAMASHLNRKIIAAKVAQAQTDNTTA